MINDRAFLASVGTYVASYGLGTLGTDLWLGTFPSTPGASVGVLTMPAPVFRGEHVDRIGLQVLIRDPDPGAALTKASSVYALFDDKWNTLHPDFHGRFLCMNRLGVGWVDESNNTVYTLSLLFVGTL